MKKKLVHLYTGDGEGKTTAAFGLALRALGRGWKVCIIQFLKGLESGEVLALKKFPGVRIEQFGREGFVDFENPLGEDYQLAEKGLESAKEVIYKENYDLVILDEINLAVAVGLVREEDVLELIEGRPPKVELILTGRGASSKLVAAADYVTEFKKIKHPFERGEEAREGIEF